ncbi:MAG TPA: c-type cytochrome domain-containing protein [Pirellulales bacterium]|nr:c-type cytochrome domain-containing protein [Pirellulales bacterium]
MMRFLSFFVAVLLAAAAAQAAEPDYATAVAPVFKKYCTGCHNSDDRDGNLVLESYAKILEGGEHGAVVAAGRSADSLLVRVLTGKAKPSMPPDDEAKPSADEIALLSAWIDAGAKGPEGAEPDLTTLVVPKIAPRVAVVDPPTALACSPDGSLLAEAHYGAVELVRRSDRQAIGQLAGHRGRVTSVSFSPDGMFLAAAAGEPGLVGEVRLWRVADGTLVRTFTGHRDSLYAVVISPDGKLLATGSYDQQIKLWEVATGAELRTLTGHNDAVYDLAFRPDGRVLASASGDRTVKLWDVATGTRLDTLSQSLKELYAVAFSPDGRRVAAGGVDNRIRVWEVSADAKENTNPLAISKFAHEAAILELVYSRDGQTLVSAGEDKQIQIWNAPTMSLRGTLEAQPDWPAAMAISPDSSLLYVSRLDGSEAEYPLARAESNQAPLVPISEIPEAAWYGEQPPVAALPRVAEVEPNDAPADATPLAVPAVVAGKIETAGQAVDADLFRFEAKAGERWIIETMPPAEGMPAQRPIDSKIEVLAADGRPVERLLLRAVRDSEQEFRSVDSNARGMRFANYEEIDLDDLVYLEGEVCKQYQQRRGPDADADVYPEGGARFAYFDTTPRTHALASKVYVVQAFPVTAQLPYNGLPVFRLRYENDDDGERRLGTFSHLTFTAPTDGSYLVRVTDVRGFNGPTMGYQLVVRRPQPDFAVDVNAKNLTVPAGGGKRLDITVDRRDGFYGPIRVEIDDLPPGFYVSSPIVIEAGQRVARAVLSAHPSAPAPTEANAARAKVRASAVIGGSEVLKISSGALGKLALGPKPPLIVRLAPPGQTPALPTVGAGGELEFPKPADLTIAPGTTITLDLSIERNGDNGIVSFDPDNLPFGVIVDNIGLNGIQLLEGQTQRTLYLSATADVPEQDRLFELTARNGGGQASLPLLLHVRKPAPATAAVAAEK